MTNSNSDLNSGLNSGLNSDFERILMGYISHEEIAEAQQYLKMPVTEELKQTVTANLALQDIPEGLANSLKTVVDAAIYTSSDQFVMDLVNAAMNFVGIPQDVELCNKPAPEVEVPKNPGTPTVDLNPAEVIDTLVKKAYTYVKDLLAGQFPMVVTLISIIKFLADEASQSWDHDLKIALATVLSRFHCTTEVAKASTAIALPGLADLYPVLAPNAYKQKEATDGSATPSSDAAKVLQALVEIRLEVTRNNENVVLMNNNTVDSNSGRIPYLIKQADQIRSVLVAKSEKRIGEIKQLIKEIEKVAASNEPKSLLGMGLSLDIDIDFDASASVSEAPAGELGELGIDLDVNVGLDPIFGANLNQADYVPPSPNNRDCLQAVKEIVMPSLENYHTNIHTMMQNVENRYSDLMVSLNWVMEWLMYYEQLDSYYYSLTNNLEYMQSSVEV